MPMWVALVRKTKLKDTTDFVDIATVEATTKEEAIEAISSYAWPESWWTNNSQLSILKIFDLNNLPQWANVPSPSRIKGEIPNRRRRRRYVSE